MGESECLKFLWGPYSRGPLCCIINSIICSTRFIRHAYLSCDHGNMHVGKGNRGSKGMGGVSE